MNDINDVNKYELLYRIKDADLEISAVDWFGNSILAASYDRSIFVYNFEEKEKKWKKE